jgi:hypothetical protein
MHLLGIFAMMGSILIPTVLRHLALLFSIAKQVLERKTLNLMFHLHLNTRRMFVPEARRDTGSNGNRGALQFYFNIMCFDNGDFGSRENGDAAGIARLADGKEGCM